MIYFTKKHDILQYKKHDILQNMQYKQFFIP